MSTPHNQAENGEIAEDVLMPGDPLRAKFIAEHFLTDIHQFNSVRNMFGYTGFYKGKRISVMGGGMGIPSLGIYVSELYQFYGVKKIIRVGSAGSYSPSCKLFDVVIAQGASTNSAFADQYKLPGTFCALGNYDLIEGAVKAAKNLNIPVHVGNVLSSDTFYSAYPDDWKKWADMGVLAVEMETYALYCLASYYHKEALGILTISDSFITHQETTHEERQVSLINMIKIALELL